MVYLFRKYFLFFLFAASSFASAQNHIVDSLRTLLKKSKEDTSRVNLFIGLFDEYQDTYFDSASKYANAALELSKKLQFKRGKAKSLYRVGYIYIGNDNEIALNYMQQSLKMMEKMGMKKNISSVLSDIGFVHQQQGRIDTALSYFNRALKQDEENKDEEGIAYSYNNLGTIYYYQGKIEKGLEYFQKALAIREKLHQTANIANTLNNISGIYMNQEQYQNAYEYVTKALAVMESDSANMDKEITSEILANLATVCSHMRKYDQAILSLERSIKLNQDIGQKAGLSHSYNGLAEVYQTLKNFDKALENYFKALAIAEDISQQRVRAHILVNIAEVYTQKGDLSSALKYADEGLKFANEVGFPENIEAVARILSIIYAKKKNYQLAYEYHVLNSKMRDSITSQANARILNDMQTKYETEKKDKEIVELNKNKQIQELDIAKKDSDIKRQGIIIWSAIGGILLLIVLAFFIYSGYRQKKQAHEIITTQKSEVEKQKHIIEEKNKDITDSINYAQRIQSAILPSWEEVEKIFAESFVLYKPRDIISGDFYWFSEKTNHALIAACDCTGHGVPGALMSMIGSSLLHQIVNEKIISDPAQVLNELDKEMTHALHQHGEEGESRDGMDIAFLEIDKQKRTLRYAGANRSLYIIRNKQLIEVLPDKNPIGGYGYEKKFNTKVEALFAGDALYIFSDGYPDQFGGEKQKKITTRQFKQLLLSHYTKPMNEQKEILEKSFDDWKGTLEQIDDVLVIGIRI